MTGDKVTLLEVAVHTRRRVLAAAMCVTISSIAVSVFRSNEKFKFQLKTSS